MHLFNTKKQVPHPGRIFLVPRFVCTGVKPDLGQAEAFSAPGWTHLPAKKKFLWCKESLVFLSPRNPAQLALQLSLQHPIGAHLPQAVLGKPTRSKDFLQPWGLLSLYTGRQVETPSLVLTSSVFSAISHQFIIPTNWIYIVRISPHAWNVPVLGTVITLVQHKELQILSFPPRLAYASGKERN